MSLPNINNYHNLQAIEINSKILELKKEIFYLKLKKATKQNIKPHTIKHKKRELAQLLTLETFKYK